MHVLTCTFLDAYMQENVHALCVCVGRLFLHCSVHIQHKQSTKMNTCKMIVIQVQYMSAIYSTCTTY